MGFASWKLILAVARRRNVRVRELIPATLLLVVAI
jgi:hypothetical protein